MTTMAHTALNKPRRPRPRAWDSATIGSAAISVVLTAVIGLSACGPQNGASSSNLSAASPAPAQATQPAPRAQAPVVAEREAPRRVERYGVVRSVEPIVEQGKTSGAGAVIGGAVGALAGNQIGDGSGRTAATIGGAAGGALLGNHVEKNRKRAVVGYDVTVEMPNGDRRTFRETRLGGLDVGDRVRVEGGHLVRG